MASWSGCYATYTAARRVAQRGIDGDIVECGVWQGGSSLIIGDTLAHYGCTDKQIWMYDTYEGMPEPTDEDTLLANEESTAVSMLAGSSKQASVWAYASLEDVDANISTSRYPRDNFEFVRGKVEDTIPDMMPEQIALLRLDTDWYESTAHELEHLFPRLVKGGVLICDDYGFWAGARKAVDEYFAANDVNLTLILADTKIGGVLGIKE